jgi:hypothetical protein
MYPVDPPDSANCIMFCSIFMNSTEQGSAYENMSQGGFNKPPNHWGGSCPLRPLSLTA